MKLRIAYFCRNCNEEVNLEKTTIQGKCPHCKFSNTLVYVPLVYEWKVEDLEYELPEGMNYGDCSPINFLKVLYEGVVKSENENTKTISKKRRKISDR